MSRATVLALLGTACGGGTPDADPVVRADSAGIEIVRNPPADEELAWEFEREWSIGGSADERLAVSELAPFHVATDGAERVYVLEEDARRVIVVSAAGAVLDTLGSPGDGPGELGSPSAIAVDDNGSVSVYDYGRGGLVRWSATGEPLDFLRVDARFWGPGIAVTDAGVVFTALAGEGAGTSSQRLAVWSPEADRTLVPFERMPDRLADFPTCGFGGLPVPPLFAPELVWYARGSRVVVNVDASYVLDLFDEGRLVRSIRRDLEPLPVDRGMALREVGEGLPIPVANCTVPPDEVVRGRGYADVLPSVRRVVLSPEGDIWVLRGHVAGEPIRIDVFAADGAYRGTARPDVPFPVAFLGAERMVVIEPDAMDAPRLAAWRIRRP
ncbi:MAG TPA: hypothetical protein VLA33_03630 [Gemmatimonadota bacterium]|nr:hypothetical protein [Gemmatimonadota bacterium]